MKLVNRTTVRNNNTAIMVSYSFLATLIVGLIALLYFNISGSDSMANDVVKKEMKKKATAKDFRILQNGSPIIPVMGVGTNLQGVFEIQVRSGVELKKDIAKPISAEVALLRGENELSKVKFASVKELKSKDLQPWINSNFQTGDKIAIRLMNTVLEPEESTKVYSLAPIY